MNLHEQTLKADKKFIPALFDPTMPSGLALSERKMFERICLMFI